MRWRMIFHTVMVSSIVTVCCAFFLYAVSHDPASLLFVQLLLPLSLVHLLLRRRVRSLPLFLLLHLLSLLIPALTWLLPVAPVCRFIMLAGGICLTILSLIRRGKEKEYVFSVYTASAYEAVLIAAYFLSSIESIYIEEPFRIYLIAVAFVYLCAAFITMHDQNMEDSLHNAGQMLRQPIGKVRRTNRKMLLVLLGVLVFFCVLVNVLHVDRLLMLLGSALLLMLRLFFSLFQGGEGAVTEEGEPMAAQDLRALLGDGGERSEFWALLFNILAVLVLVGAAVCLIYGIYRFFLWYSSRRPAAIETDEYEETSVYLEERPGKEKRKRRERRLYGSEEQKIRRRYRRLVEASAREAGSRIDKREPVPLLSLSDCPRQILTKFPTQELEELTPLYEKIRYSKKR